MNILKYWWLCIRFFHTSQDDLARRDAQDIEFLLEYDNGEFDEQSDVKAHVKKAITFTAWYEMRERRHTTNAHMPLRHYVVWNWIYKDTGRDEHYSLAENAKLVVDHNLPGHKVALEYMCYYYRREQLREGRPWLFKLTGS